MTSATSWATATGAIVTSGDLGLPPTTSSSSTSWDYAKLGDYMHEEFPDTIVANVGQKGYQVESTAASSSDYYVRMGSKKNDCRPGRSQRAAVDRQVPWPTGVNLPTYISDRQPLHDQLG